MRQTTVTVSSSGILPIKAWKFLICGGILGQYVFAIPELNAVVVRLGHKRSDTRSAQHYPDDIDTWLGAAVEMIQESTENQNKSE